MASEEPKMRGVAGGLTSNKLTEREDDFTYTVVVYFAAKRMSEN